MSDLAFKLFCPYQLAWGRDRAGVKLAEKSRRIGWTYFDAFDATINRVGANPTYNFDCWYSATDMTAAEEYIGYVAEFAAMVQAVAKISAGEMEVPDEKAPGGAAKLSVMRAVFDNGLRITAGSSNPNFFRSKGGEVKLDELAFHRDGRAMYKAALASARFWGYPLSAWSSHHGPGSYFNKLLIQARDGSLKASVHSVNILQAVDQGIVERVRMRREKLNDIPAIDEGYRREWLAERRAECPDEDTWNEEFMCVPSTDASSLLSYDLLQSCEVANLQLFDVAGVPDDSKYDPNGAAIQYRSPSQSPLYAGFDVGRKRDLSVLWVLEKIGDVFWTRVLRVMDRLNFSAQEGVIHQLMQSSRVKRLCIDSTGIGLQLSERLQQRYGKYRVEAVNFSAPVKSELAMPLRRLFEDKLVRIPMDDAVREDLHAVRKIVTAANNVRLDVDRTDTDGHADRFWSLALAYHASDRKFAPLPAPLAHKPSGW